MAAVQRAFSKIAGTERVALLGLGAIALGAVVHAASYDFVADDAFIALRYARSLIENGELAYNPGERVEGFTSPLWVFSTALFGLFGVSLPAAARLLGALALALTLRAVYSLWRELEPDSPAALALVPGVLVAAAAPVAAWAMSGLEPALFGLLLTLSVASIARSEREPTPKTRALAATATALAALCRPEGAVLVGLASLLVASRTAGAWRERWRSLAAWLAPIAVLLGGYFVFRLAYFGAPLPNTFYVKTSGVGLLERGIGYLELAAREFGWLSVALLAASVLAPLLPLRELVASPRSEPGRFAAHALIRATLIVQLVYVARVGGDFLDLYRFIAPFLPLAYCLITASLYRAARLAPRARTAALIVGLALLVDHGRQQWSMAREALTVDARSRKPLHLEPLGWTRLYGRRWSGLGQALGAIAGPGDTMAVGAAGAAPFYAGIPNLDLFGLNDAHIARFGRVIGNRPGHQRFATTEYILSKAPTFLLFQPEHTPPRPQPLRGDRFWNGAGYVEAEIRVDGDPDGAYETFYQKLLVRADRARELAGKPGFRAHLPSKRRRDR